MEDRERRPLTTSFLYQEFTRHVDDCMRDRKEGTAVIAGLRTDVNDLKATVKGFQDTIKNVRQSFWRGVFAIVIAIAAGTAGVVAQAWIPSPQSSQQARITAQLDKLEGITHPKQ